MDGDWIHFTQLTTRPAADGSPQPLSTGTPYKVRVTGNNSFQLIDPNTNQSLADSTINASSGSAVKELTISSIAREALAQASGTDVTRLVVTTSEPHHLVVGAPIVFNGLQFTSGDIPPGTYYVTSVIFNETTGQYDKFAFGDSAGTDFDPLDTPVLVGGRVTAPLFKAGGVFMGGEATLKFSFDGGFQSGSWLKPTDFKVEWRTVTVPWDLGDLRPGVPLYVYGVIRDAEHAPVTPVKEFDILSIHDGVVTLTSTDGLSIGDSFMFHDLTSPNGVSSGTPYFITSISGTTFRYSTTGGGAAITGSSAIGGIAYVDQGPANFYATDQKGLVSPHVNVSQAYRFSMAPTRSVFVGQPTTGQELSWSNGLIEYNTFQGKNQLLRMQFEFQVKAAIAGTIYNDFEDDGQLDLFDAGLSGATVFLDDNGNGILDSGEQSVTTGYDGTYLLAHSWAATDTSSSTYTTWVKVIPRAGYKAKSSSCTALLSDAACFWTGSAPFAMTVRFDISCSLDWG